MNSKAPNGAGRQPVAAAATDEASELAVLDRRRTLHAFDWGVLAAFVVALVYGLLWGTAFLEYGLIAVAVMGGWLVGAAVRRGAWQSAPHAPDRRLQALGASLAFVAWFGAAFVAYLISRAQLAGSDLDFAGRLAELPFSDYLSQQYDAGGLLHIISIASLAIMGWRGAR